MVIEVNELSVIEGGFKEISGAFLSSILRGLQFFYNLGKSLGDSIFKYKFGYYY
ncbi:MAG: hypothetical protein RR228_02975 [Bacilli bacterium]